MLPRTWKVFNFRILILPDSWIWTVSAFYMNNFFSFSRIQLKYQKNSSTDPLINIATTPSISHYFLSWNSVYSLCGINCNLNVVLIFLCIIYLFYYKERWVPTSLWFLMHHSATVYVSFTLKTPQLEMHRSFDIQKYIDIINHICRSK